MDTTPYTQAVERRDKLRSRAVHELTELDSARANLAKAAENVAAIPSKVALDSDPFAQAAKTTASARSLSEELSASQVQITDMMKRLAAAERAKAVFKRNLIIAGVAVTVLFLFYLRS